MNLSPLVKAIENQLAWDIKSASDKVVVTTPRVCACEQRRRLRELGEKLAYAIERGSREEQEKALVKLCARAIALTLETKSCAVDWCSGVPDGNGRYCLTHSAPKLLAASVLP